METGSVPLATAFILVRSPDAARKLLWADTEFAVQLATKTNCPARSALIAHGPLLSAIGEPTTTVNAPDKSAVKVESVLSPSLAT
jgi:hypothetical protein